MPSETVPGSWLASPLRRRKTVRRAYWVLTVIVVFPLLVVLLIYVQHVLSLLPWQLSGEIARRPDVREALESSALWSLGHFAFISVWLLIGVLLYRKARMRRRG